MHLNIVQSQAQGLFQAGHHVLVFGMGGNLTKSKRKGYRIGW